MLWSTAKAFNVLTCSTCGTEQILAHFRAWDGQGVCLSRSAYMSSRRLSGEYGRAAQPCYRENTSIQQRRDEARLTGCENE